MIDPNAALSAWTAFYTTTAAAAAALTGLMFVVITLVRGTEREKLQDGMSTFSTPTVMEFGMALLASLVMIVPWRSFGSVAILVGIAAAYGFGYAMRAALRSRRLTGYIPDAEDLVWFFILPLIAYAALFAGAVAVAAVPYQALYALGGAVALLIFIGIRNAWDIVTYIAMGAND